MKKANYDKLAAQFEAYESACDAKWREPGNPDYHEAVSWTFDNLLSQIRFILWDEDPGGHATPCPPDDLPF